MAVHVEKSDSVGLFDKQRINWIFVALFVLGVCSLVVTAVAGANIAQQLNKGYLYSDLKRTENQVWTYFQATGRWPGDCDQDGVIEFSPLPHPLPTKTYSNFIRCSDAAHLNVVDPVLMSVHSQQGAVEVGHVKTESGFANVIVFYQLSADVAQWLDETVDGEINVDAGRIRRWDNLTQPWLDGPEKGVALAYLFEPQFPLHSLAIK